MSNAIADARLVDDVRRALAGAGDPDKAVAQQRYMKSDMPYRGIAAPELRALVRPLLRAYEPAGRATWEATVRTLWDEAEHREERYVATALARHRKARPWLDPASMPLFRHLVVTGAWWDHVDEIAQHLVGAALVAHRAELTPVVREWATDADPWIRRTAVLCQVGHRAEVDRDLLRYAVEANVDDRSFWLRKAIGWALRDLARADPDWVRAEVERLGDRLSGLSRREALKNIGAPA